ncbi:MAG: thiamine pyrophosphate-dependent enzyme [Armatimonadota bacterium]|nr:thiamine pyrophosphate-dependent enzyme [Armatimonadota bacterium]MDR7448675.1 thiamine pyrophosphate-dependent enzyme [Armatimonadota bacterium]MDR7459885.1 thiamine pyrophosphate-dependent enzyme [Armatimonadota bacterium]MDR7479017.1 thiamine pyrophosphate-dependent enzyme [Armatimonadota bacterium]MDR7488955.1 thiamine pyrophosphate-dependent enzyme [Armatimonadota bacterium]
MSTKPAARTPISKVWEENAVPRHRIQWCPGCGDYAVLNAVKMALTRLELMPHEVLLIGGIGCSGQIRNYLNGNALHGTHGGPLAYAVGVTMANPELRVIALAGDGDTFAIGVENFVHACRRDPNVALIVMDNGVYGLTTGQRSPTGGLGQPQEEFSEESPPAFNPLRLALAAGATFVAQSFSGDPRHSADVYVEAIEHPGFAFVNDFSPCVTYNKFNTYDWFKQHVELVPPDHDPADLQAAFRLLDDFEARGRLPLGVIYRRPRRKKPQQRLPMWDHELADVDLEPMLRTFR